MERVKRGAKERLQSLESPFQCRTVEMQAMRAVYARIVEGRDYSEEDLEAFRGVIRSRTAAEAESGGANGSPADSISGELKNVGLPKYLVLFRGDSGMGKTRLCRELERTITSPEASVYQIWCYEVEGIPFKPILRVIREIIAGYEDEEFLVEKYRYGLASVLPELYGGEEVETPRELPADTERNKVFDCLTQLLLEIAASKPIVIFVHDIHWGDRGTLELLRYMGRNIQIRNSRIEAALNQGTPAPGDSLGVSPRQGAAREYLTQGLQLEGGSTDRYLAKSRLLICANYRSFPAPTHYLAKVIESLGRETFALHGCLPPLGREEVEVLLRDGSGGKDLGPEGVDQVCRLSGGNPLFVLEALRVMRGAGPSSSQQDTAAGAPEALEGGVEGKEPSPSSLIEARVRSCSPEELEVFRCLAVVRKPVGADLIAVCLKQSAEEIARSLRDLMDRDFVVEVPGREGPEYTLQHWEYAQVVYRMLDPEERKGLHQRIGEATRERFGSLGDEYAYEIFSHLRMGYEPRAAVPYGLRAGNLFVRTTSLEKAILVYLEVLGILAHDGDLQTRLEVLERMTQLEMELERYDAAKRHFKAIFNLAGESLSKEKRVDLLMKFSEPYEKQGRTSRALKILAKALKYIDEEGSLLAARLYNRIAQVRVGRGDRKRAINFCLKGMKSLRNLGVVAEMASLRRTIARAYAAGGEYALAVDNYEHALDLSEQLGEDRAVAEVLDDIGRVYLDRGDHFRAARYVYRSLEIKKALHDIEGQSRSYDDLGIIYCRTGDHLRAIEHLNRGLEIKERIGLKKELTGTLTSIGVFYYQMGEYTRANRYFRRSLENAEALGDTSGLVESFINLGWVSFQIGEMRQVESLLKQVRILADEFKLKDLEARVARLAGNVAITNRDWVPGERNLRKALEIHAKVGTRRDETEALLDLALLNHEREHHDEALKLASRGQVVADQLKAPDLVARALMIKGNVYRFLKGGNVEKAKEPLVRASEIARNLTDVHLRFGLEYSLGKLCHSARNFEEAAIHYRNADKILAGIVDGLGKELTPRFYEDKRRKVFLEDQVRFRKEATGRVLSAYHAFQESATAAVREGQERPLGPADYRSILDHLARVHAAFLSPDFFERVVAAAIDLVRGERSCVFKLENRHHLLVCSKGIDAGAAEPEARLALELSREAVRKARPMLMTGSEAEHRFGGFPEVGRTYLTRSILVAPMVSGDRVFGTIYADRPGDSSAFTDRERTILDLFARQVAIGVENRMRIETAIRDPDTRFYHQGYFREQVRECIRLYHVDRTPFGVVGMRIPETDPDRVEIIVEAVRSALPPEATAGSGPDGYVWVLLREQDEETVARWELGLAERLRAAEGENGAIGRVRFAHQAVRSEHWAPEDLLGPVRERLGALDRHGGPVPQGQVFPDGPITLKEAKQLTEKQCIARALSRSRGNITQAARELGLHRPQLSVLLKKHAIRRELFEEGGGGLRRS